MSNPMLAGEGAAELLERPIADTPMERLEQLFTAAAKPDAQWLIGMEIEVFTFHEGTRAAARHETIRDLLEALGARLGMAPEHEQSGALIGLKGNGESISLEPGGQLELATKPHRSMHALRKEIVDWGGVLNELGGRMGLGFWALGLQPFVDRDTAPVMPKPRYAIMRDQLRGSRARDMMHLTGSVQVAVDFKDEGNMVDKIRTAARVSPFLSALVASSPFSAGRLNGFKSMRYEIWLDTDAARCGIWPEMVDAEGLTARRYIERTLDTPAMFFRRSGVHHAADGVTTFRSYARSGFQGSTVTVADYLDHLTTFFPEIRPKGYVELRGADCVKPWDAVAIAGFWRGLLDDEPTRVAVDERLAGLDHGALVALQAQVARLGLEAESAIGPVAEVAEWLVQAAHGRLRGSAPDCAECVEPLLERARARRSPADELIEAARVGTVESALELARI